MIVHISSKITIQVDDCDIDLLNCKWHINHGYVVRNIPHSKSKQTKVPLHRLILERKIGQSIPDGMHVDHINHDKLDNRRDNLRLATNAQNQANIKIPSNNASGRRGVYWNKRHNKWCAQIMIDRRSTFLGYFSSKKDAIKARREAEIRLLGEYAPCSKDDQKE